MMDEIDFDYMEIGNRGKLLVKPPTWHIIIKKYPNTSKIPYDMPSPTL